MSVALRKLSVSLEELAAFVSDTVAEQGHQAATHLIKGE
jgi:hypothetical protein